MDKRTETVSFRTTHDIKHALEQIALSRDVTVSDLCCEMASDFCEQSRAVYLRLRAAFEKNPDLPGFRKGDDE